MKLLYDHQTFLLQRRGGISRYFVELISRLSRRPDVAIDLFMGIHINAYGLHRQRGRFHRYFGLRRPEVDHLLTASLLLDGFLFSQFARRSVPDIYHQTYFYTLVPDLKARRVVTVYDMIYELYPGYFRKDDVTPANKKRAVEAADAVICISESTKTDLLNILRVPEEKVTVIHLGNSFTWDVTDPPAVNSPYVLYVGKRGGYKNFETLLAAWAGSTTLRTQVMLVCFGGESPSRTEAGRLKALGVESRVLFLDGHDHLLANLYKYAAALVYPSLHEGFGMPPLEAMHFGCPAIASRTSSMPEIMGDAGLYFDPHSAEELRACLETVLGDSHRRSELINAGYKREKLFTWDRCAQETFALYQKLLQ